MKIHLIHTCDTCRKALKALRDAGLDPEVRDLRKDGMSHVLIHRLHAQFGDGIVNRQSRTWRDLDPAARALDPVSLIGAHPLVMKRPVIEADGILHLGWSPETRAALL